MKKTQLWLFIYLYCKFPVTIPIGECCLNCENSYLTIQKTVQQGHNESLQSRKHFGFFTNT